MGVMVRGKLLSQKLMLCCFSTVILLSSAQQGATASGPIAQGLASKETMLESHLPVLESPANMVLPARTNPIENTRLVIRLRERRVYLYRENRVQTSYPIAIGKTGWETPTGSFKVMQMIRNPAWEHPWTGQVVPPGPNNPLGTRWIAFWTDGKNSIGFHGTPNERLIGQAVSHGCIRMRNQDVVALYEQVSVGTPVIVER
ncbi:MAG TPA: L,D-transpeptidase [Leptolyngbyaceae cyanobacterium]